MPSLPSAQSTGEAGKELIAPIMSPAMEPIKAAGAALGNPLQTLGAPPVVMAAAAAMGTMFGGDSDTSDEKLKTAGEELSESSIQLNESTEGLVALSSVLGFENIEIILEDIRDSNFGTEKAIALLLVAFAGIEKIEEWAGKIFDKIEGADAEKPMGPLQSAFKDHPLESIRQLAKDMDEATEKSLMTAPSPLLKSDNMPNTREIREKVDPTARLRAIEEKREAARAAKKPGETPGEAPAEEEMDDISYFLQGLKMGVMKFIGPVMKFFSGIMSFFGKILATAKVWGPKILKFTKGFGKLMGKLFLPITILIGAVSMITGFIEGFKEGGIIEGFKQGFMNVIKNLIDIPLNLIKDMISWIARVLGFEEFAADLDSFEFDFAGLFGQFFGVAVTWVKDTFNKVWPKIKELFTFTAISDTFSDLWIQLKETLTEVWETIKAVFSLDNIKSTLSDIPVIGGWFKSDEETAPAASLPNASGLTSEKPASGALGIQEPDDGWWSKVSSIFNESALQASEQAAAAAAPQGGGATVVNAPSTQVNNVSGQTMIAAPKAIIRGESVLESAAFQP